VQGPYQCALLLHVLHQPCLLSMKLTIYRGVCGADGAVSLSSSCHCLSLDGSSSGSVECHGQDRPVCSLKYHQEKTWYKKNGEEKERKSERKSEGEGKRFELAEKKKND
jgi:hypothetical protein